MVDLTEEVAVTSDDLKRWYNLDKQLKEIKGAEAMLRKRIASFFFPTPTEGSKDNKHPLNDGTGAILQMEHNINRKVDQSELEVLSEAINAEGSNLPQLDLTKLIKWTPEVSISEYRKLSNEERAVFDRCLVITPGMPGLEIKIPKR